MQIENSLRKFSVAEEWIYFKFFSGPKILESILINEIYEILVHLLHSEVIDKFFFVRYSDPDYQIRLRLKLTHSNNIQEVFEIINRAMSPFLRTRQIWRISIDTYSREIERYGISTIEQIESLFYFNSLSILNLIKNYGFYDEEIRWLWGIKFVNEVLNKFNFSIVDKINFVADYYKSYSKEFNLTKYSQNQLNDKYRNFRYKIFNILSTEYSHESNNYIDDFFNKSNNIIINIYNMNQNSTLEIPLTNLLGSIFHMHFNRLFRTKQRLLELVMYYLLHKYYVSINARKLVTTAQ